MGCGKSMQRMSSKHIMDMVLVRIDSCIEYEYSTYCKTHPSHCCLKRSPSTKMANRRELIPGLAACRTPSIDGKQFNYTIENATQLAFDVTIDISQSKNVL